MLTRRTFNATAVASLAATPAVAQGQAPVVKVGTLKMGSLTNVWVAKQAGFFERNGLNVELVEFRNGNEAIAAHQGGSVDILLTIPGTSMAARERGFDLVLLTFPVAASLFCLLAMTLSPARLQRGIDLGVRNTCYGHEVASSLFSGGRESLLLRLGNEWDLDIVRGRFVGRRLVGRRLDPRRFSRSRSPARSSAHDLRRLSAGTWFLTRCCDRSTLHAAQSPTRSPGVPAALSAIPRHRT